MTEPQALPEVIADRYVVEAWIGAGGMAQVARVVDRRLEQRIALKFMKPAATAVGQQRAQGLFEREFQALVQLDHPNIVRVFDYGKHDGNPYYTMELLDGGDLAERGRLPWTEVCSIARELCSALSLIHARRMVYRDLTPKNVRCTGDGKAKLLDFGAIAPLGTAKFVVCTPAVAAPEVVNLQSLDGRTDLYALGSTIYHCLTGRAPYPAVTFAQLPSLWERPPRPPSEFDVTIPGGLDELVLDLLQLDAQARPENTSEVAERLCAVAGLPNDEEGLVSQAYLTTPAMVGCEHELAGFERRLERLVTRRRGCGLVVVGAEGAGRSRFLDACVLQGKFAGVVVLRLDGSVDVSTGDADLATLGQQLICSCPEQALAATGSDLPVLSQIVPELLDHVQAGPVDAVSPAELERQAPAAMRRWITAVAARQPLLVVVDEVERLGAASRSLIALLALRSKQDALIVLAARCRERERTCDGLRLLDSVSSELLLRPLTESQVGQLLASIFGNRPGLAPLTHRLHAISCGSPRGLLTIVQHLLDQGAVYQVGGAWVLPEDCAELGLPDSMSEALEAVVDSLDDDSRALVHGLCLTDEQTFGVGECLRLIGQDVQRDGADGFSDDEFGPSDDCGGATGRTDAVMASALADCLTEVLAAGVVAPTGERYRLSGRQWVEAVLRSVGPEGTAQAHQRLAGVYGLRGDGVRAARHWLLAGDRVQALSVLADHAVASSAVTMVDPDAFSQMLEGLPREWFQIYDDVLSYAKSSGASRRTLYGLRNRLLGIISHSNHSASEHMVALTSAVAEEAGLDIYDSLGDDVPPSERLRQSLARAQQRYSDRGQSERIFDPITGLRNLARLLIAVMGNISDTLDVAEWDRHPRLGPFASLSPGLALVHKLSVGFDARLRGRYPEAITIYRAVLEALEPGHGLPLDPTYVEGIRGFVTTYVGMAEAVMGQAGWRERAAAAETMPMHSLGALTVRELAALWQGDVDSAARHGQVRDLRALELGRPLTYRTVAALWRFQSYALSDDLSRTQIGLRELERLGENTDSFLGVVLWARGEYERIRGDYPAALDRLDGALSVMEAGRDAMWAQAAGSRLVVLCALGRELEAVDEGARYLAMAGRHQLNYVANGIRLGHALSAAKCGDADLAWATVQTALQELSTYGQAGLSLGLVHEVAASVALHLGDAQAYGRHLPLCRQYYLVHGNHALAAKWERLHRAGRTLSGASRSLGSSILPGGREGFSLRSTIVTLMQDGRDPRQSLRSGLQAIVEHCAAQGAYVFSDLLGELRLVAATDSAPLPEVILNSIKERLAAEQADGETMVSALANDEACHWRTDREGQFQPVVLCHEGPSGVVVGGLMVLRIGEHVPWSEVGAISESLSRSIVLAM